MTDFDLPVDVLVKDTDWHLVLDNPENFCRSVIDTIRAVLRPQKQGELSIALIGDAEIQVLNKTYRGKDVPTNVLSFPDAGPAPLLGDIAIARETVLREAETTGLAARDHTAHMLVHGFLHLQGYDHENDADAAIMEALEIEALHALNIDNPYKINEPSNI